MDRLDHYLTLAADEKLKHATEIHKINLEMSEYLSSSLGWIIHYCKKHNIPLPDLEKIENIIDNVNQIESKLPYHQPKGNTEKNYRHGNSTLDSTNDDSLVLATSSCSNTVCV